MAHASDSHSSLSRRQYLTLAGATGIAGLAGCASSGGKSGSGKGSGSKTSYKVGVTTPLSGTYAFMGKASLNAMKIAKSDLENKMDVKIDLVVEDTETKPSVSLEKMKKLVNKERVDFALGGVSSSDDIKMGNWASDNGVVYVASGSHSSATTGSKCAKYMWRTPCSNNMHARAIGKSMASYADSWFLIYSNYTAETTLKDAVAQELKANGAKVAGTAAAPWPAKDFSPYLNQAESSGAKGLGMLVGNQSKFIKQYANKGLQNKMKMAGPIMEEGLYWKDGKQKTELLGLMSCDWSNEVPKNDLAKHVVKQLNKRFNQSAYDRTYMGYTSLDQLIRAAERAGSVKAPDIRDALAGWKLKHSMKKGKCYWRKEDNQLVQPTYTLKPLPISKMQDKPYKSWFKYVDTVPGDQTVRKVNATGCSL